MVFLLLRFAHGLVFNFIPLFYRRFDTVPMPFYYSHTQLSYTLLHSYPYLLWTLHCRLTPEDWTHLRVISDQFLSSVIDTLQNKLWFQDTVVGLQALSAFATKIYGDTKEQNMDVGVTVNGKNYNFDKLTKHNVIVLQSIEVRQYKCHLMVLRYAESIFKLLK